MLNNKVNLRIVELGDIHDPGDIPNRQTFDSLHTVKVYDWLKNNM
jgi:hypothetical protein